jgi:hypothetical protein
MVTVQRLIEKNDRDIALFQKYIATLMRAPGTGPQIGDLKRRIAMAERSNEILRSAR